MEGDYVFNRKKITDLEFEKFTRLLNISGTFEAPTIGLAVSGGGFRSMLTGAGILGALDSRTPGSIGQLGGILQSSAYIAGISGGLWIVVNNLLNDGTPIFESIDNLKFDLQTPVLEGVPNMDLKGIRQRIDEKDSSHIQLNQTGTPMKNMLDRLVPTLVKSMFAPKVEKPGASARNIIKFYKDISIEAQAKRNAGFRVSVIDYWARTLARKVFPKYFRSTGFTFSSAAKLLSFQNYSQPFPIMTSIELVPSEEISSRDSHIFEITPFEFGSWDSYLGAFMNIKYLGTDMWNGKSVQTGSKIDQESICVSGYDTLAFLTATSSGLFNTLFRYVYKLIPPLYEDNTPYIRQFLQIFGFASQPINSQQSYSEYAIYSPNPFRGYKGDNQHGRSIDNLTSLYLADGGEDGQNIPFSPYLVPARKVDAVLAYDMGSEVCNRPNGSSLRALAQRYHASHSELKIPLFQDENGVLRRVFPKVLTADEFFSLRYHQRPVFFGCDMEDYPPHVGPVLGNFELKGRFVPPIIIYQANHDISFPSNTSTFRTSYLPDEVEGMFQNGNQLANNPSDKGYRRCLWCAFMTRKSPNLPNFCQKCFEIYCYKS